MLYAIVIGFHSALNNDIFVGRVIPDDVNNTFVINGRMQ